MSVRQLGGEGGEDEDQCFRAVVEAEEAAVGKW